MSISAEEQPRDWAAAIDRIVGGNARRVVVIGPTNTGKSSFIRCAMAAAAHRRLKLIDLDPGQKMIGPPGTVALGDGAQTDRLIFIGSTSASELSKITAAAEAFAGSSPEGFIANTAGFVRGIGARLQSWTIANLEPDLVIAIGDEESLEAIVDGRPRKQVARLQPSPFARRKSPAERASARQRTFASALKAAVSFTLEEKALGYAPGPPKPFDGAARPVCALETGDGDVLSIGILQEADPRPRVFAEAPHVPVRRVQLGKIWAEPTTEG